MAGVPVIPAAFMTVLTCRQEVMRLQPQSRATERCGSRWHRRSPKTRARAGSKIRREETLPDDPATATFQGLNADYAALDIDRGGREREDFGYAASAPSEHEAKEACL